MIRGWDRQSYTYGSKDASVNEEINNIEKSITNLDLTQD